MTYSNRLALYTLVSVGYVSLGAIGCEGEQVTLDHVGSQVQALTFPASNTAWIPVEQLGLGLTDPDTDAQNNGRNIVGTTQYPAVYIAASDTHFMVRLRLNDNPISGQNLAQYGWGILFEIDGDASSYDYLLLANASGANDVLTFYANTTKTGGFSDNAETLLHTEAINTGVSGNVRVTSADSSLFGGLDYILGPRDPVVGPHRARDQNVYATAGGHRHLQQRHTPL